MATYQKVRRAEKAKMEAKLESKEASILSPIPRVDRIGKLTNPTSKGSAGEDSLSPEGVERYLAQLPRLDTHYFSGLSKLNNEGTQDDVQMEDVQEDRHPGQVSIVIPKLEEPERIEKEVDKDSIVIQKKAFEPEDERLKQWSADEIWVMNKLLNRGREPLLPKEMAAQFTSWPDNLFSTDPTKTFVTAIGSSHDCMFYLISMHNF